MWNLFLSWWCWKIDNEQHGTFIWQTFRQQRRAETDNPPPSCDQLLFFQYCQPNVSSILKFFPVGDIWEYETWIPHRVFQTLGCFCFRRRPHPRPLAFLPQARNAHLLTVSSRVQTLQHVTHGRTCDSLIVSLVWAWTCFQDCTKMWLLCSHICLGRDVIRSVKTTVCLESILFYKTININNQLRATICEWNWQFSIVKL